jgi:nicotinamide-nucleotide amidase
VADVARRAGDAVKLEVLTIGGEILNGRIADGNFQHIARQLARLGAPPLWHTTVPDRSELLLSALRGAIARADGIIVTGGLGGTPDDITRRVLAQALGRRLVLRQDVKEEVERIYLDRGRTPPPSAEGLALMPQGAEILPNPVGLAPGILLTTPAGGFLVALPGVPEEMRTLLERFVLPFIERRLGVGRGWELTLRTAGVPETVLAERIGTDEPDGCEVAYLPHWGGVDLRLVRRPEAEVTREDFDAWASGIRERLGDIVYATGEVPLEHRVGELAVAAQARIAVAESITGGGVGAALTRVPGSSAYFLGGVTAYDNEVKQRILGVSLGTLLNHGAVSAPVAESMAVGMRRISGADVAVSTTGIAGPSGATAEKPVGLVYLGISSARGDSHVRRVFPGRSRESITQRAVFAALWLLYRHLAGLSLDGTPEWSIQPRPGQPGS